ncbi:MAG: DMT family transporter [Bacteroidales bacterium]
MHWFWLALLTALCEALKDVFSKHNLKSISPYIIALAMRLFSVPLLLPVLFFIEIPDLGDKFWLALCVGGSMNVFITILYLKAIQYSDLSVTVPMVTFTPMFLLITSPLIVGEFPGYYGIAGILCIVLGSYMLNIHTVRKGFFAPFKALIKDKGPRYMLGVAFLWSITANIDKVGIQNSGPVFWVISISVFLAIGMLLVVLLLAKKHLKQIKTKALALFPVALFSALTLVFQMLAIQITLVAYVISIKRTSALMVVVLGVLLFKEKGFSQRITGAIIMLAGVMLISLF